MGYFQFGQIVMQEASTATSNSTTTLTNTSKQIQYFTGTSGQTVILPNATTMVDGQWFEIYNGSSGSLTIQYNGGASFSPNPTVSPGSSLVVKLVSNGSSAGTWAVQAGGAGGGGGGGSKNYLSSYIASTSSSTPNPGNGNFENGSTSGWSLAHSALSSLFPSSVASAGSAFSASSGGSAASGNLSLAVVSSGQLSGNYSGSLASSAASTAGDMLISNAFFIDAEDQAKMMTIKFYYNVNSGAANMNFSGSSSNSLAVYIYDVTNGAWIQPQGVYNLVQNSGSGYCTATFQTTSNSSQYQLALVNINATSGAYTLYVDDFSVGPQTAPMGPAISDWQPYNLVIQATGSNPTMGTATVNNAQWRRVGDSMQIQFQYTASGGSAGSGSYIFPIPTPYTIDLNKINDNAAAVVGAAYVSGASGNGTGFVWVASANGFFIDSSSSGTANGGIFTVQNTFNGLGSGVAYSFFAEVPIVGWGSNSVASSDTDTRVVAAVVNTSSSSLSGNIVYTNIENDTHAAYNPSTGIYTVPVSGFYDVDLVISAYPWSSGSGHYINTQLFKNGSAIREVITAPDLLTSQLGTGSLSTIVYCNAGDTLNLSATTGGFSGASADGSAINNFISFSRRSGPAVITATETVGMTYGLSVNTAATGGTPIYTDVKIFDTHDAFTPSSGIYVIPVSGKYRVSAIYQCQTIGVSGYVVQNGVGISYFGTMATSGEINGGSIVIPCNAGDQISVNTNSTATFQGHDGLAYITSISIMREGN